MSCFTCFSGCHSRLQYIKKWCYINLYFTPNNVGGIFEIDNNLMTKFYNYHRNDDTLAELKDFIQVADLLEYPDHLFHLISHNKSATISIKDYDRREILIDNIEYKLPILCESISEFIISKLI